MEVSLVLFIMPPIGLEAMPVENLKNLSLSDLYGENPPSKVSAFIIILQILFFYKRFAVTKKAIKKYNILIAKIRRSENAFSLFGECYLNQIKEELL